MKTYFISEIENISGNLRIIGYVFEFKKHKKHSVLKIIDDSFGKADVIIFEDIEFNIGDIIEVIGVKKDNKIIAKKIFKREEDYYLNIVLELIKYKKNKKEEKENIEIIENNIYYKEENHLIDNNLLKVYNFIKEHPLCSLDDISINLKINKKEVEEILKELIARGEIYEPQPGKFMIV